MVQHDGFIAEPPNSSITRKHAVFSLKQLVGFLKAPLRRERDCLVILMDVVHPAHGIGEPLLWCKTQNGFDLGTYVVPGTVCAKFRDIGDGRETLNQGAIAILGSEKLNLGTVMFDGDSRQVGSVGDDLEMLRIRNSRLAVVDSKGSKNRAILRRNWGRPAGTQAVRQSKPAIFRPQRVAGNI